MGYGGRNPALGIENRGKTRFILFLMGNMGGRNPALGIESHWKTKFMYVFAGNMDVATLTSALQIDEKLCTLVLSH